MDSAIHRIPGLVLIDHDFEVPLDHTQPEGEQISVFAREVVAPGKEKDDLPWMVFFQGGPGFSALRPESRSGWLDRALREYRVLLLDQRGTGRSTPVLTQTLAGFYDPEAQADYLKHFRADAIVQDAELIRKELLDDDLWSVLGQSYGGFCAIHYLSRTPQSLREVIITGGLPPLDLHPDDIYRATYQRVIQKNEEYYQRYPRDAEYVHEIVDFLTHHDIHLPNGDRLSPRRLQQLGITFGAENGFEQVHYLIEQAIIRNANQNEIGYPFLKAIQNVFAFDSNPIFVILHEAIYCQNFASDWSADRIRVEYPIFDISADHPIYFTGEMIYPWIFDEYSELKPLKKAADILAIHDQWPRLYDIPTLEANDVPCAAAIYYNDMYVERAFSEDTARRIKGMKLWITNQYEHSGLRLHGYDVLDRLLGMLHGIY